VTVFCNSGSLQYGMVQIVTTSRPSPSKGQPKNLNYHCPSGLSSLYPRLVAAVASPSLHAASPPLLLPASCSCCPASSLLNPSRLSGGQALGLSIDTSCGPPSTPATTTPSMPTALNTNTKICSQARREEVARLLFE
jgi:hypothetical protein